MKYSFTAFHPPEKAVFRLSVSSSSVTFLLMASRRRWVPASGAKVSPAFRPRWSRCISSMEKLSARREGRERFTWFFPQKASRSSHRPTSSG